MSRQTLGREIDGIQFNVTQLPGMRGVKLLHKLTRAAGPAILKALSGGTDLASADVSGLGDALQGALDRFTADDLEALIKELFETATMAQGPNTVPVMPVFNDALAGKPGTIMKALKFALEVNYSDFLGELLASAGTLAAKGAPPLP